METPNEDLQFIEIEFQSRVVYWYLSSQTSIVTLTSVMAVDSNEAFNFQSDLHHV